MMSVFARETVELFNSLNPAEGEPLWYGVGGLEVAWTPERFEDLKRKVGAGKAWDVETYLLGPDETREKVPLLSENVYGAMYTPGDGNARAWMLAGEWDAALRLAGAPPSTATRQSRAST